jgi:superfamily I DNA/RNA helicase
MAQQQLLDFDDLLHHCLALLNNNSKVCGLGLFLKVFLHVLCFSCCCMAEQQLPDVDDLLHHCLALLSNIPKVRYLVFDFQMYF